MGKTMSFVARTIVITQISLCLLAFIASLAMKVAQRYIELVTLHNVVDFARSVKEGLLRRIDDPSLWAVLVAAIAGGLVLRSLSGTIHGPLLAKFKPMDWVWTALAVLTDVGLYCWRTRAEAEGLWWDRPGTTTDPRLLTSAIEWMMDVEGVVYITVIVLSCLLVPIGLARSRRLSNHDKNALSPDEWASARCQAASLASLWLTPPTFLFLALFVNQLLFLATKINVQQFTLSLAGGILAGVFLCWPVILLGIYATMLLHSKYKLTLMKMTLGHLLIIGVVHLYCFESAIPCKGVLNSKFVPNPAARGVTQGLVGLGFLGLVPLLWFDSEPP